MVTDLKEIVEKGNVINAELRFVEEEHIKNNRISQEEQKRVRDSVDSLLAVGADGNKIKLF